MISDSKKDMEHEQTSDVDSLPAVIALCSGTAMAISFKLCTYFTESMIGTKILKPCKLEKRNLVLILNHNINMVNRGFTRS